jgi:hypothetical protein
MSDTATDKNHPPRNNIGSDKTTRNTGKQSGFKGMDYKVVREYSCHFQSCL